jgi:hypothetical protein
MSNSRDAGRSAAQPLDSLISTETHCRALSVNASVRALGRKPGGTGSANTVIPISTTTMTDAATTLSCFLGHTKVRYTSLERTMTKARTIYDYYVTVFLHRYHTDTPSKAGERIEVIVRIPEEAANIFFGFGPRPKKISHKIYRRACRIARQTVGIPQAPWAVEAISVVESTMPSDLPETSGFQHADGSEGWIYSVKSGVPRPPPALIVEPDPA